MGPVLSIAIPGKGVPVATELLQNYPNPFNPATVLRFELPQKSRVHLAVYNMLGQLVATLTDGVADSGTHEIRFDGNDRATGVVLARLEVRPLDGMEGHTLTTKLILIRQLQALVSGAGLRRQESGAEAAEVL